RSGARGCASWVGAGAGAGARRALFDCGLRGDVLESNARYLGVSLRGVETILLSHGHPDHFGGLPAAARLIGRARVPVLLHEAAFRERRWTWKGHVGGSYRLHP